MLLYFSCIKKKPKKKHYVKPLTDINTVHVYENKKRIRSVYPNNSEYTINYIIIAFKLININNLKL